MAVSRYSFAGQIDVDGVPAIKTNLFSSRVFRAVESGSIKYNAHVLEEGERLDTLAYTIYGDSSYWWVIAAANGLGKGTLIVPANTKLRIPAKTEFLDQVIQTNRTR